MANKDKHNVVKGFPRIFDPKFKNIVCTNFPYRGLKSPKTEEENGFSKLFKASQGFSALILSKNILLIFTPVIFFMIILVLMMIMMTMMIIFMIVIIIIVIFMIITIIMMI